MFTYYVYIGDGALSSLLDIVRMSALLMTSAFHETSDEAHMQVLCAGNSAWQGVGIESNRLQDQNIPRLKLRAHCLIHVWIFTSHASFQHVWSLNLLDST